MNQSSGAETLQRIEEALGAARSVLAGFPADKVRAEYKSAHNPVTEADRAVNEVLHQVLVRPGEGWFSEETVDDLRRLEHDRVWLVDPIDGTNEFLAGISEWCISIGLVEEGRTVAGGICNPVTGEVFLGAVGEGVTYNGNRVRPQDREALAGALVLASRSELKRGEWECFRGASFTIQPMGSVAYKLARVAAALADATWTLCPKHEWDIAAGVALVEAGGGFVYDLENHPPRFNRRSARLSGLMAGRPGLSRPIRELLAAIRTSG